MKSRLSQEPSSRSQMLYWINRTLGTQQTRIQNLGNGIAYSMLIHHFQPIVLPLNKINMMARAPHQFHSNLRKFQQALNVLGVKDVNFDVYKVAQMGYQQNWQLISKLYRVLNGREKKKNEMSWQAQIQNASLNFSQNHMPLAQNLLSHPVSRNISKFQSVKTPLRLLKQTDRIEGNKNIPSFSSSALGMVDKIKKILQQSEKSDKNKVKMLKNLLGIEFDEREDDDIRQFLSDQKKKQCIVIDQ